MEYFASQDPRSYSFYFDLNIRFRAWKVIGILEKRAADYKLLPSSFVLSDRLFMKPQKICLSKIVK